MKQQMKRQMRRTLSMLLPKLTKTEEQMVEEAKEALQTALEKIEVSNDTTKDKLKEAIEDALTEAGIAGVDVTVGDDFAKTDATTETAGKVTGTVTLTAGNAKDTLKVDQTIAKLPNVSGGVTGDENSTFEITIKKGNEVVKTTAADETGKFDFSDIPDGIYNIVIVETTSSGDKKIVTGVIEVKSGEKTDTDDIAVGDSQTEVKVTEQAPDVVAGGLDKLYTDVPQEVTDQNINLGQIVEEGGTTKVVLKVDTAEDTEIILALKTEAEKQKKVLGTGFDAEVLLQIAELSGTEQEIKISDTKSLIHMVMPLADSDKGKTGYQVFRSHLVNGAEEISALPELTTEEQAAPTKEGFYVDGDKVHIWASKFSTYVLTYDAPQDNPGENGGNENGGNENGGSQNGGSQNGGSQNGGNGGDNGSQTGGNETPTVGDTPAAPTDDTTVSEEVLQKNALALNAGLKVSQTGSKLSIRWGKVKGADGYEVYVQYGSKKFTAKSVNVVKGEKKTRLTVKKIDGKKLDTKKDYKVYVNAYKMVGDKKVSLGKSITTHVAGSKNAKYTNPKTIKLKKKSYKLKVGKSAKIKATIVQVNKNKKALSNKYAKKLRYASSNKKVATVSKTGKIKAVGKGTCTIYVYAKNGNAKKVKVTVK